MGCGTVGTFVQRRADVEHRGCRIGAVERFYRAEIIGLHIFTEGVAVALNRERRRIFHVLEQSVEYVADLVDEFVQIVIKGSVIGRDDCQFGIVFEKHKAGEMNNPEPVERSARLDSALAATTGFHGYGR